MPSFSVVQNFNIFEVVTVSCDADAIDSNTPQAKDFGVQKKS
jgi:hypothetical protein